MEKAADLYLQRHVVRQPQSHMPAVPIVILRISVRFRANGEAREKRRQVQSGREKIADQIKSSPEKVRTGSGPRDTRGRGHRRKVAKTNVRKTMNMAYYAHDSAALREAGLWYCSSVLEAMRR